MLRLNVECGAKTWFGSKSPHRLSSNANHPGGSHQRAEEASEMFHLFFQQSLTFALLHSQSGIKEF